ncbi:hypothetical protein LBMAG42_21560 [Deltaproteobacteria bacterium]|nr:hypothetical protein LBMAG42_21560 [Deltaproteobacteria bacterium]
MSRRGGAAVEFGILLPVLAALLGGTTEFGWFFSRQLAVIQAARDGALAGSLTEASEDPASVAESRAREALTQADFDPASGTLTAAVASSAAGAVVTVSVTVPHSPLMGLIPVPDEHTAVTTMRLVDQ